MSLLQRCPVKAELLAKHSVISSFKLKVTVEPTNDQTVCKLPNGTAVGLP